MANIAKLLGQPPTEGPRCYPSRDAIVCTTLLAWPWSKTITTNSNSSAIKSENMPSASVMAKSKIRLPNCPCAADELRSAAEQIMKKLVNDWTASR